MIPRSVITLKSIVIIGVIMLVAVIFDLAAVGIIGVGQRSSKLVEPFPPGILNKNKTKKNP